MKDRGVLTAWDDLAIGIRGSHKPEDAFEAPKEPAFRLEDGSVVYDYDNRLVYNPVPIPRLGTRPVVKPQRVRILEDGAALTHGDRDKDYGPPAVNMAAAGALKAAFRAHMTRDISPGELEALDVAMTKLGRIATGPKPKRDNYVDGATYLAIAGEIALDLSGV